MSAVCEGALAAPWLAGALSCLGVGSVPPGPSFVGTSSALGAAFGRVAGVSLDATSLASAIAASFRLVPFLENGGSMLNRRLPCARKSYRHGR